MQEDEQGMLDLEYHPEIRTQLSSGDGVENTSTREEYQYLDDDEKLNITDPTGGKT